MNDRIENIRILLASSREPIKGQTLAKRFNVTRQVIVKDIALLRAKGINIISTSEGYMMPIENSNKIKRIIAVSHTKEHTQDELNTIVKYGAMVEDVIVEHKIYGEIKAMIMVKSIFDVERFMDKFNDATSEPLSSLTNGIHLHTISADSDEIIDKIIVELNNKGYLIDMK